MIGFTASTGTKKTVDLFVRHGWGMLLSADYYDRHMAIMDTVGFYSIDNGAWSAFQKNEPFDVERFLKCLETLHAKADWFVLPDIVQGGVQSLHYSLQWWKRLDWVIAKPMLAVQDGMTPNDLPGLECGIFVGGSTEWKLANMERWAHFAHEHGQICHVGRVNTRRRMVMCSRAKVDSFDGSGGARFYKHAEKMVRWLHEINNNKQQDLGLLIRRHR